jgi:hypothetical protein
MYLEQLHLEHAPRWTDDPNSGVCDCGDWIGFTGADPRRTPVFLIDSICTLLFSFLGEGTRPGSCEDELSVDKRGCVEAFFGLSSFNGTNGGLDLSFAATGTVTADLEL